MNNEEHLSAALHAVADNGDTTAAPTADLIRRGRRGQRVQTVARLVAAVGVVAAIGGATALAVSDAGGQPGQPGHVTAARVDLVSAAAATSGTSFRFTLTGRNVSGDAINCHGGLDRRADVGWEKDASHEVRFINGKQYVKLGDQPWHAYSARLIESFDCTGPVTNGTIDPAAAIKLLQEKGQVRYAGRTGDGQDAVDVYKFTHSAKGGQLTYSGSIAVGVASGYIQKMTTNITGAGSDATYIATYSGFGEPVKVTAPNVQ